MSRSRERKTLATCCSAHALHDGLSDILYVLLPVLAQAFNLSLAQVGLIRSAHRAAMSLFQIPVGIIAERVGERNLLALGTVCLGMAFIGLGFTTGFVSLLILMFLAGFGAAFQHPLASAIISAVYHDGSRRIALGTYNFAGDFGKVAVAGTTSLVLAAGVDWREPVTVFGLLGIAGAAAILFLLRNLGAGERPPAPEHAETDGRAKGWGVHNVQGFSVLCTIKFIDSSTRNAYLTFVAFLMIAKGVPENYATIAVPMIFVGGMAGKLAIGFLAERFGVVRTVVLAQCCTVAGILLTIVLPDMAAFLILPVIGITLNGASSALYGSVGDFVDPRRQSRAFGLFYTLGSLSGIVAPVLFGILGDVAGIRPTIAVTAGLACLTIPLCLILRSTGFQASPDKAAAE